MDEYELTAQADPVIDVNAAIVLPSVVAIADEQPAENAPPPKGVAGVSDEAVDPLTLALEAEVAAGWAINGAYPGVYIVLDDTGNAYHIATWEYDAADQLAAIQPHQAGPAPF